MPFRILQSRKHLPAVTNCKSQRERVAPAVNHNILPERDAAHDENRRSTFRVDVTQTTHVGYCLDERQMQTEIR